MLSSCMWLGDFLPSIYEAAMTINYYSKRNRSALRTSMIYKYAQSLIVLWEQSFGEIHVMSLNAVLNRLSTIMTDHGNRVRLSKNKSPLRIHNKNMDDWLYYST